MRCEDGRLKPAGRGFTLIELMIVVAIIALLSTVAIPKFAGLLRRSREGAGLGNLGTIRAAINIYSSDLDGQYPETIDALTIGGKYLGAIPPAKAPDYHSETAAALLAVAADDAGGWVYNDASGTQFYGEVHVNCTDTDTKGAVWSSY